VFLTSTVLVTRAPVIGVPIVRNSTMRDHAVVSAGHAYPVDARSPEPDDAEWRGVGYRVGLMTFAVLLVLVPAVALFPGGGRSALTEGLRGGFTTTDLVLFVVVALVAAAIKGFSGFGYALIATPLATLLIDPTAAVVVLAIPPLMLNLFQVGETGTGPSYLRQHWSLVVCALVGSAVGVYFLSSVPRSPIIPVLIGLLLLGYVVWQLIRRFLPAPTAAHPLALGVVGTAEGFLLGAVNIGPLLPAYLHTFERNARRYIGGMSLVFSLVFAERIVQMFGNGLMSPYRLWLGSVIALITLVGLLAGTALRRSRWVNERAFTAIVVVLLAATGITILVRAVPQLVG